MEIPSGYQPAFQLIDPLLLFKELAFWAVPVVARVVCLLFKTALVARVDMPAQRGGPACGNIAQCFELCMTQVLPPHNLPHAHIEHSGNFNLLPFIYRSVHDTQFSGESKSGKSAESGFAKWR